MPVIAVVNRKGGSGKSTLAAHLAAWCARRGHAVMLGDVDRQQSTRAWLRRRSAALPAISPWSLDQGNVLRVPSGITHAVLDTPGGMQGFELARVVMAADAVLMPVCDSMFDRESAAACHAELMTLPRVASGRCRLAAVGMRVDGRTRGAETLRAWAEGLGLPMIGTLRETKLYVKCLEQGLTLFDLPAAQVQPDLAQWEPLLQWLEPAIAPRREPAPVVREPVRPPAAGALSPALRPVQDTLVHGSRLSVLGARPMGAGWGAAEAPTLPSGGLGAQVPHFLRR
jgi:chromosome partitioning protein